MYVCMIIIGRKGEKQRSTTTTTEKVISESQCAVSVSGKGKSNNYFDHQIRGQHFLCSLDLCTCCSVVVIRELGRFPCTRFYHNIKSLFNQGLHTGRRQCHPLLILEDLLGDSNSQLLIWNSYKQKKKSKKALVKIVTKCSITRF